MPVLNTQDHSWNLDQLIAIHGLKSGQPCDWAIQGIAQDLQLTVAETCELLQAHGVEITAQ